MYMYMVTGYYIEFENNIKLNNIHEYIFTPYIDVYIYIYICMVTILNLKITLNLKTFTNIYLHSI